MKETAIKSRSDSSSLIPSAMELSSDYKKIIRFLLQFAAIMLIIGLLLGLITRETGRLVPFSTLSAGYNIQTRQSAEIVHGHTILTCTVLPVVMAAMLLFGKMIGGGEIRTRSLQISIGMYIVGILPSLTLLFYKGIHTIVLAKDSASNGTVDFEKVDGDLFGGIIGLRSALYGIFHILFTCGLAMFALSFFLSLTTKRMVNKEGYSFSS